jgi:hypothetical protein
MNYEPGAIYSLKQRIFFPSRFGSTQNIIMTQGLESLVKILNYCDYLLKFSDQDKNVIHTNSDMVCDIVRDLCFHLGFVSLILLDDSKKRKKESSFAYKLRQERVSFLLSKFQKNNFTPEILSNRDIRNSFAHIDEYLADSLSAEPDIGWYFNLVSSNRMNNIPEGISKIKYFNSYIINEWKVPLSCTQL